MATKSICSIPDCGKSVHGRGFCPAHYRRLKTYGDPLGGHYFWGVSDKFLKEQVLPYDGDECLIWPFSKNGEGRGCVTIDGDTHLVHRIVCEARNGPPPSPSHEAAHSCGKGHMACVTGRHLSWKTRTENQADRLVHGTTNRGERNGHAKLTSTQVLEIRALAGSATQAELATQFGISKKQVWAIIHQKWWKHVA